MSTRRHRLLSVLVALLFIGGVMVLYRELHSFHLADIAASIRAVRRRDLALAALFTAASYAALTMSDLLAFRYARGRLPLAKAAFASFVSNSVNQSAGFAGVFGGSIRYRLYTIWGIDAASVAKVVGFNSTTVWGGFLAAAGVSLLWLAPSVLSATAAAGAVFVAIPAAYVALSYRRRRIALRGVSIDVPPPSMAFAQLAISVFDWMLAAAALFVLLPAGPSFARFAALFLVSQLAGVLSGLPGGIGVFDSVLMVSLRNAWQAHSLLTAMILFRLVYYLVPLLAGSLLLVIYESYRRRHTLRRIAAGAGGTVGYLLPYALAAATFAGGVVLLLSGATPPMTGRFSAIQNLVTLPVVEMSHLVASVTGAALLLLARGLQRRLNGAFYLTVFLLLLGSVLSLLKGFDYEEALVLLAVLAMLVASRSHFYRRTTLIDEPFTAGWVAAIVAVIVASVTLGFFSFKGVAYSHDLWWEVSLPGHAPRFLRASLSSVALLLLFGLVKLFRPPRSVTEAPTPADIDRAEEIARRAPTAEGFLALTGDKRILFDESGDAFLMYASSGRSFVAMGDPIGDERRFTELCWQFREECDRADAWPVFYEASPKLLPVCIELGLSILKIGEAARVPLDAFSLDGGAMKYQRKTLRQVEADGWEFEVLTPDAGIRRIDELRAISDEWLGGRRTREKRFSLGWFDEAYLARCPIAVVRRGDQIVAFANLWMPDRRDELSVDLMRYRESAPAGVMDFLFLKLMLFGKSEGYRWFLLGMAPLSGLEMRSIGPLWNRIGALAYSHGENFYNFQGLRQYKEKFRPVWEPRYLAVPRGLALPRIVTNLATLISAGVRGVVSK